MTWKNTIAVLLLVLGFNANAQCFDIESVLVDACGPQEGLNEMVRFRVGNAALNTSNMSVNWPSNNWLGLVKNATTAAKTAALNADIQNAGGCGQLIEPTGGVLPANAQVILVTSFNIDVALNQFGPITENYYIIYQNNANVTAGHFANFGTGLRTLTINFGSCSDSVTYNRALLIDEDGVATAGDGATVLFAPNGTATYINNGCAAPVPQFTVEAGSNISACAGTTVSLNGSAQGQTSVQWTGSQGTFASAGNLSTQFAIDAQATGTITLTLTATNACNATVFDTVTINVTPATVPDFPTTLALCNGQAAPALATVSPNGISGTWNPSAISNTQNGSYVFTPNTGQCASPVTLNVSISSGIVPDFDTSLVICNGSTAPTLQSVSPNGISGSWNPPTISNTQSGSYVFTPNAGQCASAVTLNVSVVSQITPDFDTALSICEGSVAPILNTTSPNGITGSWNPSAISNAQSGTYVFMPDANQCASSITLAVTVTNGIVPDFDTALDICYNSVAPVLASVSPNGISGTWSPAVIDNTQSGVYTFTPDAGQCATTVDLTVNVQSLDFEISQGCDSGSYWVSVPANFDSYQWTDENGNVVGNSPELNVSEFAANSGLVLPATFELEVSGDAGCSNTKSVTVTGILCTIPKGVSANGDGMNDAFNLSGYGVSELKIYNRYGMEVYSKRDYTNEWSGQSDNGDNLPSATYYYAIRTVSGEVKTGWVYLIRKS